MNHYEIFCQTGGGQVELIEFLIDEGADPNSVGQFGRTPIYRASFAGHVEAVQVCICRCIKTFEKSFSFIY